MSDAPTNPDIPRPRTDKEYEDPQYHDEELDIQNDDLPRPTRPAGKKSGPRKLPPPRRRFED